MPIVSIVAYKYYTDPNAGVSEKLVKGSPGILPLYKYTTDNYGKSPKLGNPIARILKSNVQGFPALFCLNPVSNFGVHCTLKAPPWSPYLKQVI